MWTNEDPDSERQSLDIELGRRLSQLSENAKFAVGLNQIQRVAVRDLYDSPEHDGATVYVMDVYIHKTQKGLPTANAGESKTARKRRLQHQQESERPEYDVEHRYSDFRALRQRIYDIVDCTEDQLHPVCRKHKLELFVNQLLNAAKDVSYRHGGLQCERFVSVSRLLQSFLLEPQVLTPGSMCCP
ncbi:hypothetical protein BBP00_00007856 [Phytophthora kernoviae]|uniref:PX domain-containing protein n=1 Tax=Phytophthora kernoviae TaxID=325452 RepID=A0A3F2RIK2_9STRA|nr:hypothetical protein BBP00_00007856 [Phytophthora kernoviae]